MTEITKTKFRRLLTVYLVSTVSIGLLVVASLAFAAVNVSQLVIAYGTYTTFAAAIIATNLATKPAEKDIV